MRQGLGIQGKTYGDDVEKSGDDTFGYEVGTGSGGGNNEGEGLSWIHRA